MHASTTPRPAALRWAHLDLLHQLLLVLLGPRAPLLDLRRLLPQLGQLILELLHPHLHLCQARLRRSAAGTRRCWHKRRGWRGMRQQARR